MGSVHCTSAAMDDLVSRRGLIIVISSVAGFAPLLGRSSYCASKHALHGFFDTLRLEQRATGVDVLMVCPSYIDTPIRRLYQDETPKDGKRQTVGSAASPDSRCRSDRTRRRERQAAHHPRYRRPGFVLDATSRAASLRSHDAQADSGRALIL